jgi:xanthine/uracil permease
MELQYSLDSRPGIFRTILYGLQWFAVTIPAVVIIGKVLAVITFPDSADQILYMQRLFFVTGAVMVIQPLFGHKLPLISGPSSVLLIGIIASSKSGGDAIYFSIFAGGLILSVISFTGGFSYLQRFFTTRVVSVILLLIAFTILPVIIDLIFSGSSIPVYNLAAVLFLCFVMYRLNSVMPGLWKPAVLIAGIITATILYRAAGYEGVYKGFGFIPASPFSGISFLYSPDPGVMLSFLFCFLALAINDIGSIQSLRSIPGADGDDTMERRVSRGMGITGLANAVSGFLGIIGPVNYSMSPGVIASTGCGSRFTVVPAGILLFLLSAFPGLVAFISDIPEPVVGIILLYLMGTQFSAGMMMISEKGEAVKFNEGIILGFPILLAVIISFLPGDAVSGLPRLLRPIIGNGFVMGVLCVIMLEHWILKERTGSSEIK